LLEPLVGRDRPLRIGAYKIHGDDTPVPVLCPGRGTTKQGRLWTYVRDDRPAGSAEPPAVLFRYSPDRKGERPRAHLANFTGALQADAYAGFDRSTARRSRKRLLGARAAQVLRHPGRAFLADRAEALERIGRLYKIEEEIRGGLPP
jgi:transposase